MGALVLYPIFFSVVRSLFDAPGDSFVGADNYRRMFTSDRTLTSIKNNAIWVAVAPTIATILGLIFAVLTERVRWATAFKVAVFMPMAISFLATGVIWRLVYEQDPSRGVANAALSEVVDVFRPPGSYPGARPSQEDLVVPDEGGFTTTRPIAPGEAVQLGLIAINPRLVPESAELARPPVPESGSVGGVAWLDFTRGGGGERGVIDPSEAGLPGMRIEALSDGRVVGATTTAQDGTFSFPDLDPGSYAIRLAAANFREPYGGFSWLGPSFITPAVIVSFLWIWAGFAMVVIGAGLAAIPRDVLEAARVDGGTEWQVFRRVTVPLLIPVLLVVVVTLAINVLKIFDLVFVIPPGSSADAANVLALEMWQVSFGGGRDQGLGSALSILLFVLVFPAIGFNLRRFKAEQS